LTTPGKRAKFMFSDQSGRRRIYAFGVQRSGRHPDLPLAKRLAVSDPEPVTVFPPLGIESRVELRIDSLNQDNRHVFWHQRVQRALDCPVLKIWA
jgi:hypothetical protein